jgi:hypothetical protein
MYKDMSVTEDRLRRRVEASIRSAVGCSTLDEYLYFQRLSAFYHFDLFPCIRAFWFGNPMTSNRADTLRLLRERAGVPVQLITEDCLPLVPEFPLHPAFEFLSLTHKSDYMRTYMMHVHGGAYSDVKNTEGPWSRAFEDMKKDEFVWINGYRETKPEDVAYTPAIRVWQKLVGNGAYICRPRTPFTHDWFSEMNRMLDRKLGALRKHPAKRVDRRESFPYPIEWGEVAGRNFHKSLSNYTQHAIANVPRCVLENYM